MATQQVYDGKIVAPGLAIMSIISKVVSVIIVGGAPAGCATALALHRIDSPRSVLVIDDADPAMFKVVIRRPSFHCLNTRL
jgi:flavin-dependent dehydrogenase